MQQDKIEKIKVAIVGSDYSNVQIVVKLTESSLLNVVGAGMELKEVRKYFDCFSPGVIIVDLEALSFPLVLSEVKEFKRFHGNVKLLVWVRHFDIHEAKLFINSGFNGIVLKGFEEWEKAIKTITEVAFYLDRQIEQMLIREYILKTTSKV